MNFSADEHGIESKRPMTKYIMHCRIFCLVFASYYNII